MALRVAKSRRVNANPNITWAEPGDLPAVAARVAAEVTRPGKKRIAMAGGSTPGKVLALLAAQNLDWSDVTIVPTDDRQVPADHPASNLGALRTAFAGTAATILPLVEDERPDKFDLVWLGMGADGHIASLFPRMCALPRRRRRVIATVPIPLPAEAPFARLSLNRKALAATREIILVVTGRDKRIVIEHALAGGDSYPVSDILRGGGPRVTIYWSE